MAFKRPETGDPNLATNVQLRNMSTHGYFRTLSEQRNFVCFSTISRSQKYKIQFLGFDVLCGWLPVCKDFVLFRRGR